MQFNSIDFAIFLPLVFAIYWFALGKSRKLQNFFILAVSYLFYGWWDWRFLFLLAFSTIVDYSVGILLPGQENPRKRALLLGTSIVVNLGLLGFFKYYNFFADNFMNAFTLLGARFELSTLRIVLPVGISFYTFQTMSYAIDVYRRKLEPTRDLVAFSAFVTFFPQLVAGPIERATNLLPQFLEKRKFDYGEAADGMRQMLWGLVKKIVIADRCAAAVNTIFNDWHSYSGSTLVLGAVFFAFQIYGDFSGYSDIAIGSARLFGFRIMRNFAYPYFSRDIAEFWRRWHISLTTWFRDYLYIPLGGSRGRRGTVIRNTLVVFVVSGFWHGANWTFIAWGALNALYFLPLLLLGKNRVHTDIIAQGRALPSLAELGSMVVTFTLTTFAWIFFRSASIGDAAGYIARIFSRSLFTIPSFPDKGKALWTLVLVICFVVVEWRGRAEQYAIASVGRRMPKAIRWALPYALVLCIYWFGNFADQLEFIYFQF